MLNYLRFDYNLLFFCKRGNMRNIQELSELELIDKINEYSKLAKEGNLSKEDEEIRNHCRKEYILRVKNSLLHGLGNINS